MGDDVLAHLYRDRFLRGEYNKLKFKNIGPCKILHKFSVNVYELSLPLGFGISPIFNVVDLFPYTANLEDDSTTRPEWDTRRKAALG